MSTLEAPPRSLPTPGEVAAPTTDPRHLRVVDPVRRVRRRLNPVVGVLVTAVVFVVLFLIAIAHTVLVQGQLRLDDLDAELTVEQARYQELRKEVAEMESPTRIVTAAEGLGMVSPDDLVYLQPELPDPASVLPVEDREVRAAAEAVAGSTWSVMKPLLGASP